MSDSVRPHRWQPTRLCCPCDSPGKNTGVGCRFLLQCIKVKSQSEVAQLCPTLRDAMDCSLPGSSIHGIFPGKSTGVGCHCLLHGIWSRERFIAGLCKKTGGSCPKKPLDPEALAKLFLKPSEKGGLQRVVSGLPYQSLGSGRSGAVCSRS